MSLPRFSLAPGLLMATLAVPVSAHAQAHDGCPLPPRSVRAMRTCYRPILVFSPAPEDSRLAAQQSLLDAGADDMMDRYLLYVPIVTSEHSDPPPVPLDAPYAILDSGQMASLRRRFHVANASFLVILLDEDGSEKLRSTRPIPMEKLNSLIDSWPPHHP